MRTSLASVIIFLGSMSVGIAATQGNEAEPVQKFILQVDNKKYEVLPGTEQKINIAGKLHQIGIQPSPTRHFDKAGVSFKFDAKRHFSYEALSTFVDHWSLDGNNTTIIIQNYKVKVANSEIIDSFKDQYQKMKARTNWSKTKLKHDGGDIPGERLLINMGEVNLEQQIFFFNKKNETRVVILQDAINDDKSNTEEFKRMRTLFQKSLSINL